ncbi:integrase core domain-containing protein [Chloroflexota bacterium]
MKEGGVYRQKNLYGGGANQQAEAKILVKQWRREYNQIRPHSSLSYRPPAPEAVIPLPMPRTPTFQVV